MKTLPTKTCQAWAMESRDTDTVTQLHHEPHQPYNIIPAQNKNGVRQGGSTVGVALSFIAICLFTEDDDEQISVLAISRMSL